jgi:hypothetical protein
VEHTAPAVLELGLLLLLAALAGKPARRVGLPAVLGALALSAGLITKQVSAGLIGAVVVSIAASSVLVRIKSPVRKVAVRKGMTE